MISAGYIQQIIKISVWTLNPFFHFRLAFDENDSVSCCSLFDGLVLRWDAPKGFLSLWWHDEE